MVEQVIDWVHHSCIDWAIQVRTRDYNGLYVPMDDLLTFNYVHNPAGLTEEAQEVSSAVFRMRATRNLIEPHNVIVAYYLFAGRDKAKAVAYDMIMARYWRYLQAAHCYVAARIPQALSA